jgi:hypothetical protein
MARRYREEKKKCQGVKLSGLSFCEVFDIEQSRN